MSSNGKMVCGLISSRGGVRNADKSIVLKEIERDEVVKEYQQKQKEKMESTKAVAEPTQPISEPPKSTTTVASDTTGFF